MSPTIGGVPKAKESCELCGELSVYLATNRCVGCLELEKRIKRAPQVAKLFLEEVVDPENKAPA